MADEDVVMETVPEDSAEGTEGKSKSDSNGPKITTRQKSAVIDDDDEDDPVVEELDVYLGQQLKGYLYTFQYPLRSAMLPIDTNPERISAKIKPNIGKVELEISIDMNSDHINREKARALAAAHVDEPDEDESWKDSPFPTGYMNKYKLSSSDVELSTHYCVGVIAGRELHLAPVHKVIQMRPDMQYLNVKNKGGMRGEDMEESEESEEESKELTVKVKRAPTERDKRIAAQLKAKDVPEEPWVNLQVHQCKNPNSKRSEVYKRLLCNNTNDKVVFDMTPYQYLESISARPPPPVRQQLADELPFVTGMHNLHDTPLETQVEYVMRSVQVITFDRLCSLVSRPDKGIILDKLGEIAMLLNGCWVIRSNKLHDEAYRSPVTGVAWSRLSQARDLLLLRLYHSPNPLDNPTIVAQSNKPQYDNWDNALNVPKHIDSHFGPKTVDHKVHVFDGFLRRTEIQEVVDLGSDDLRDIFKGLCKLYPDKGWCFKLPTDHKFIANYSDIVARQTELWEQRVKISGMKFQTSQARRVELHKVYKGKGAESIEPKASVAVSSLMMVEELVKKEGIILLDTLQQQCLEKGVTETEMNQALDHMAAFCNINWLGAQPRQAVYARNSENAEYNEYRNAIIQLFETQHTVKRKDLKPLISEEQEKALNT
eukprot:Ihof_evm1s34 gene=Ihof_evmTU1s34